MNQKEQTRLSRLEKVVARLEAHVQRKVENGTINETDTLRYLCVNYAYRTEKNNPYKPAA